jgi:hypothetical protein
MNSVCILIDASMYLNSYPSSYGISGLAAGCAWEQFEVAVTPLVLQVYFRDHTGSLDNPNMDTQSELIKYYLEFLIGLIFRICSPIDTISITLRSYE